MAIVPRRLPTLIADRYQLDGELGRGGMAEVRAGTDLRLQRSVAVKFLLPEMAARDDIRRRFEAEARAAASLSVPHAVAVYDTGEHEGTPYIVMERLPGDTLADRIAAGPVDPRWLRQVAGEVLAALGAAHAAGLIHRDVKPGNILLTADGHAKIADFGIAKTLERNSDERNLTGTGQLFGTPEYLAPERLDGAPATARSDLYALGVVLYEALTGCRPFSGGTPLATAQAVVAGAHRPLADVRPDLDPALVGAVERAMAREPGRRFESAATMAAALATAPPAAAGTPTLVDGVGGAPTSILEHEPPSPPAPAPRRVAVDRSGRRVPVPLVIGLALVALLVFALYSRSRPPATDLSAGQGPTATTAAPATTVAPSPTSALANELRAAAARLGPADGARAGDLATKLRAVADGVDAGNGGGAATDAMISAGAWRLTGQLSDAATASAVALLSRVPGVTVVTLPSIPAISLPAIVNPPTTAAAPTPPTVAGNGNGNGKGKEDKGKK